MKDLHDNTIKNTYMVTTEINGKKFSIDQDYNLITENEIISRKDMQEIYKSAVASQLVNNTFCNLGLVFWIDVKNGKKNNWI